MPTTLAATTAGEFTTHLTNAIDGDEITLVAGTTFTGNFILPNKGVLTTGIVIRSNTSSGNLPAAGVRINPSYNAFLPNVQASAGGEPAIKAAAGANGYTLRGIRFLNNPGGYGEVVRLGSNDCSGGFCQEFESQEPYNITVDRCVFYVDPVVGQKRGAEIGGKNITITNNYMDGFAGLGQDSQAVHNSNGHGPYKIENNYMTAAAYSIMFGGDDPQMRTVMTVTGGATTTSANVAVAVGGTTAAVHNLSEIAIGQNIAVLAVGGTKRHHTILRSKSSEGTAGTIGFDPIPDAPDVPGDIRAGVNPSGISVRRNHMTKPLAWLSPIINAPTSVNVVALTTGGTLAAGQHNYIVRAYHNASYNGSKAYSNEVLPGFVTTTGATGSVVVTFGTSSNGTHTRIYKPSTLQYYDVTGSSWTDTGAAGTAYTTRNAPSYWQIKNLFEIKAAQNCIVEGNVLEYGWAGADIGYAMWIKSTNQGNSAEFVWSKDITIQNNLIRHCDGFMIINGTEFASGNANQPSPLTNLTVRNNLVYDSGYQWHLANGGSKAGSTYAMSITNRTVNLRVAHNTIVHTSAGLAKFDGLVHEGFVFVDNLARRNTYGLMGTGAGEGTSTLTTFAPGYSVTKNAIAGIVVNNYPAGNYGPTIAAWELEFNNYSVDGEPNANGPADFSLRSDSTYALAGTDSLDIGADIAAVLAATLGVRSGTAQTADPAPIITTTSLPAGTVSTAYSVQLQGNYTGTATWSKTGTLPTGLTLSAAGLISGTPSAAGTFAFSITLDDTGTGTPDTDAVSIVINATFVAVTISSTTVPAGFLGSPYSATLATANGLAPFAWTVSAGALPTGVTLGAATGIVSGTPEADGVFSFTAFVTDSRGTTDTQALSLTVTAETMPAGRPRTVMGIFQYATFRGPVAPTTYVRGDSWMDTSGTDPVMRYANAAMPSSTWPSLGASTGSHNLLSGAHADTEPSTLEPGDMFFVNEDGKATRLPIDSAGQVLTSTGVVPYWGTPATPGGGGTSAGRMPVEYVFVFPTTSATYISWGAVLASGTVEFLRFGGSRKRIDLTNATEARIVARVKISANAGSRLRAEFSVRDSFASDSTYLTDWVPLDGIAGPSTPFLADAIDIGNISAWVPLTALARADVFVRIVATGGDGSLTPSLGSTSLQFR